MWAVLGGDQLQQLGDGARFGRTGRLLTISLHRNRVIQLCPPSAHNTIHTNDSSITHTLTFAQIETRTDRNCFKLNVTTLHYHDNYHATTYCCTITILQQPTRGGVVMVLVMESCGVQLLPNKHHRTPTVAGILGFEEAYCGSRESGQRVISARNIKLKKQRSPIHMLRKRKKILLFTYCLCVSLTINVDFLFLFVMSVIFYVFRCGWGWWMCVCFVVDIVRGLLLGFFLQMCLCVGIFFNSICCVHKLHFFFFTIIAEKKSFYIYTYRLNLTFSFPRLFAIFHLP